MRPIHLNPEEAVRAALDLDARAVVGMHFGTFDLSDEPLDEPPRRFLAEVRARGLGERAFVMADRRDPGLLRPAVASADASRQGTADALGEENRANRTFRAGSCPAGWRVQLSGDKRGAISLVCATQYGSQEEHS